MLLVFAGAVPAVWRRGIGHPLVAAGAAAGCRRRSEHSVQQRQAAGRAVRHGRLAY